MSINTDNILCSH